MSANITIGLTNKISAGHIAWMCTSNISQTQIVIVCRVTLLMNGGGGEKKGDRSRVLSLSLFILLHYHKDSAIPGPSPWPPKSSLPWIHPCILEEFLKFL